MLAAMTGPIPSTASLRLIEVGRARLDPGAPFAAFYDQAVAKDAPHPAAARLWEEFLYSSLGQNLFLQGYARPIELPGMIANKTVNQGFLAKLPAAPKGALTFPTPAQVTTAGTTVDANWPGAISGS